MQSDEEITKLCDQSDENAARLRMEMMIEQGKLLDVKYHNKEYLSDQDRAILQAYVEEAKVTRNEASKVEGASQKLMSALDSVIKDYASQSAREYAIEGGPHITAQEEYLSLLAKLRAKGETRSITQLTVAMGEKHPEIFNLFYPRQYEDIGNYYSPKLLASLFTLVVRGIIEDTVEKAPVAHQLLITSFKPMIDKKMPLFFIAPQLLHAVQRTDFQEDIDWLNMPLPYEHGVFMLPKGALRHRLDGDCAFIVWSRLKAGLHMPPCPGVGRIETSEAGFSIIAFCPDDGVWYDSHLTAGHRPTLKLRNMFYRDNQEPFPELRKNTKWDEDANSVEDAEFIESLGVVVFGTLLAMTARPTLLKTGKMVKSITKPGKPKREFWSPNIIGENYQPKHQVHSEAGHGSPRLHWRRGHFRNQACGVGMKDHRVIWLEPMLVGAGYKEIEKW